jgi:uridylate kinase
VDINSRNLKFRFISLRLAKVKALYNLSNCLLYLLSMPETPYKRILLKLSGEQLAGSTDGGFDAELAIWLAREVKKIADNGTQIVIMVGGGNLARGEQLAGHGIKRVTADHIGMLATMMNALALTDIFESEGISTRCLSSIFAEQVAEPFIHRLANKHLEKGRVVIAAGGIGRPYLTTDTAAVSLALEMSCDIVMKATKVDGVYDKDPAQFPEAVKLADDSIKIMDKAAMGLAMEHKLPILVFKAMQDDNIVNATNGDVVGTLIN